MRRDALFELPAVPGSRGPGTRVCASASVSSGAFRLADTASKATGIPCSEHAVATLAHCLQQHLEQGFNQDIFDLAAGTLKAIIRFDGDTDGTFYPYLLEPLLGIDGAAGDPDGALRICLHLIAKPQLGRHVLAFSKRPESTPRKPRKDAAGTR